MNPFLHNVQFRYSQDGDGNDSEPQMLCVEVDSCGGGPYLVIKTQRWAINHPHELIDVLVRTQQSVETLFEDYEDGK